MENYKIKIAYDSYYNIALIEDINQNLDNIDFKEILMEELFFNDEKFKDKKMGVYIIEFEFDEFQVDTYDFEYEFKIINVEEIQKLNKIAKERIENK